MPLIQYLSRILFDYGAVASLAEEVTRLNLKRPLLVTDRGIAEAGILERVLRAARPYKPFVFDRTPGNPTEAAMLECLETWWAEGCDGVIALGGGSALDLSKAVALLARHDGQLSDYGIKSGGSDRIGHVAPQIAIPTAAGTGAEVGRASVMILNSGKKSVAVNLNLVAKTVICDPDLTLSLPPVLTAATGIDALSHGIEAVLSRTVNPPAGAIARDCITRAARWLQVAVEDGNNREARWQMMMAALEGGMCLQKGLGAAHAMANPLGEGGWHHGTLIGALLPSVLRFNAATEGMETVRRAAGLAESVAAAEWLGRLVVKSDFRGGCQRIGVGGRLLPAIAAEAETDHLSATNPREATRLIIWRCCRRPFRQARGVNSCPGNRPCPERSLR